MILAAAAVYAAGETSPVTYGLFFVLATVLVQAVILFNRSGANQTHTAEVLVSEAKEEREKARAEAEACRRDLEELRERMQTDIDYWRERYLAAVQGGI